MENIIIQILSILVQSVFISYYFISLSTMISNKKNTYVITAIASFIAIALSQIIDLKQYNAMLNTLLLATMLVIIMKLTFKTSILKSIIVVISYYILMAVTEITIYYAMNYLLKISSDILQNITYSSLLLIVIQHILATIIMILVNTFIIKKYNLKNLTFKNLKLLLFMIIGYILPQIVVFSFANYSYPLPLMIINILQIILVSVLIFSYFKRIIREDQIETELNSAELHNKTLIEIVDSVRTLKHDYGNIVQALNGYVITKQYEQLDEYINSLLKEFDSVNNVSSIDPKIINEPAIYGVVGAKYFFATEHDITFELDIVSNIKEINFPKPELSRIFGILLDNAIEATQKAKEKYIKLEIYFDEKKYANIIKIINTYDTSINIDLNNIYEKGISSKKVKSGIGLWEVKKLIKRNKNSQIYATIEKDKFVQNLIIEKAE